MIPKLAPAAANVSVTPLAETVVVCVARSWTKWKVPAIVPTAVSSDSAPSARIVWCTTVVVPITTSVACVLRATVAAPLSARPSTAPGRLMLAVPTAANVPSP